MFTNPTLTRIKQMPPFVQIRKIKRRLQGKSPYVHPKDRLHVPRDSQEGPCTRHFYTLLDESDLRAIEATSSKEDLEILQSESTYSRKLQLLHLGVYHRIPAILEKTGLSFVEPPEDIHSMARGKYSAGGSLYYGDIVSKCFDDLKLPTHSTSIRMLDFGCSSGRVARVLHARYTNWSISGCDPNPEAIRWASKHFPKIEFRQSDVHPPLPWGERTFDLIYAISIWSHFGPEAAMIWIDEMFRILKPGGFLIFSTHGFQSVAYYAHEKLHASEYLYEILKELYRCGFHYCDVFGDKGDWGVIHPQWGLSFISPEWLLERTTPKWKVRFFRKGTIERNQDLYCLQKVEESLNVQ